MSGLRRIVLVDDNPDDRLLVARQLQEQLPGVQVEHVADAAALDRALAAGGFDVVITDYQLRWSTGTEVLRRVKQRDARTPVVMFTASGSEEVAVEAMKQGLDDYITKTAKHYARIPYAVLACHERATQRVQLQELLQSLRERQRELEKADAQKNVFLATLAHELRNPLAPIRYSVALLREGAPPEVIRRVREVIERQAIHMARLLDDLLDLGRISQNRIQLAQAPLDLRRVVELGYRQVSDADEKWRHDWRLQLPDEALWVQGDEVRLTQVVSNLLDNAAKFTPAGGRIEVSVQRAGGQARIEVRDNGVGIGAEHLDEVFEMFSRTSAAKMSGGPPGLGIGLAVVRNLVRLHGGEVTVASGGAGQGAAFTVLLPLLDGAPATDPAQAPPAPAPAADITGLDILVADDNEDAAEALAAALREAGARVRVAFDGQAAMSLAGQRPPLAMVLDLGMPRASGLEVARWVRQQPWGGRVRLLAVSGWGQREDRQATQAAGFDAHLVKPVTAGQVQRALRGAPGAGDASQPGRRPS